MVFFFISSLLRQQEQGRARAGQGRAEQGRAGQGRAGQGRAGQGRAGQGRAGQGRQSAGQGGAWGGQVTCFGSGRDVGVTVPMAVERWANVLDRSAPSRSWGGLSLEFRGLGFSV